MATRALHIIAVLLVGLFLSLPHSAFAQRREDGVKLNEQANKLFDQGRLTEAEVLYKRSIAIGEKTLSPKNVASALNNLAVLYKAQGRYADAEPLFKRSLAIAEKTLGPDNANLAGLLNQFGLLYTAQGRYADAEPLFKRSLAILEKALGANSPEVAKSLDSLGSLYRDQGRYADAERFFKRSLVIGEKARGPDHPDVAVSLNNLAGLYKTQSRYADAEPLYKRSLSLLEKALGSNHSDVGTVLDNLAALYQSEGRYADAEPLFRRALSILEKALGPDHPDVAGSLNNLAGLYKTQSRYADAEPLFKRSLAIAEKTLGPDHPDVAVSLNSLAVLYKAQGRYADAEPLFKRALSIREKALGPDHPDVAVSLNSLASLYQDQGRFEAEPLYKRALSIREKALGPDHSDVAESLNNLAEFYRDQGRYADAEPLSKRSLAIWEQTIGPNHPIVATALNNLAGFFEDQGRYADAEPLYKRSLAITEKALGADHPDVATSLNNLAALYDSQRRYADAESMYKRSLAILEKALGPDHPYIAGSLNNLADLYRKQDRYADALPIVQRTIAQKNATKSIAFGVLYGSQSQQLITPTEALESSFNVLQRSESSAAGEAVSKLAARFAAGSDELAQLVRKDQDLTVESDRLDKSIIAAVSKPPTERNASAEDEIGKRIEQIKSERDKLQDVFNQRFPEYVALSKPQPLSVKDAQTLLADDEALVTFDFDAKSYAWVITRTNADWIELKISAKDLDEQVKILRESLHNDSNKPPLPFDAPLAYKIYQNTFGAVADKIASKKRLSLITNGALTSLPPQLLVETDPTGKKLKDQDWLVRSYAITVLPTVTSLKILRATSTTSPASKPMIAFADPVFSKKARVNAKQQVAMRSLTGFYDGTQIDIASLAEHLPQLSGTRREVQSVAKSLNVDPSELKLGLAATETAVKQTKLDQYRIVYFATHGLVSGELALFSKAQAEPALVLTIPDKPNELDDGLLQASEIAQLKLNADWVVLSACNTAAEDKPSAEALSGLARAFFYAGARSLVVSHWEVDDQSTAQLMVSTFQASTQNPKLSHAEALRQAMLTMIDSAKTDQEADPRLWAPFVIVGEPAKPR